MNGSFYNEMHRMISDTAAAIFDPDLGSTTGVTGKTEGSTSDNLRCRVGEAGLIGICSSRAAGGMEMGAIDAVPILEAAGRNLASFPLAHTIVGAHILSRRSVQTASELILGKATVSVARSDAVVLRQIDNERWQLDGSLGSVSWGEQCDWILCDLSAGGLERRLALIRRDRPEVETIPLRSVDFSIPVCEVRLSGLMVESSDLFDGQNEAWQLFRILIMAEMLGTASGALTRAVRYLGQRKQFGRLVGSFQALKHLAADDYLRLENMRIAVEHAAWAFDNAADDAAQAIDIAWFYGIRAAQEIIQDAIQMHGGIGFTWELGLHCYLRRVLQQSAIFGNAADASERIASWLFRQSAQ